MSDWLLRKSFTMHSVTPADWKIDCAALTNEDVETFALIISKRFKFSDVRAVPWGGFSVACALRKYCTSGPVLAVSDVLTTGQSMEQLHISHDDIGVVLFARGPCPAWVITVFEFWDTEHR